MNGFLCGCSVVKVGVSLFESGESSFLYTSREALGHVRCAFFSRSLRLIHSVLQLKKEAGEERPLSVDRGGGERLFLRGRPQSFSSL